MIEIKYDRRMFILVKKLFRLLDNYEGKFSISSFYLKPLIYIYRYRPNYIRGYLISSYIPRTIIIKLLLKFNLLRLNFLCIDKNILSNSYILSLRDKYLIIGYTINSYYEYYLYKSYADNFIWDKYK